MSIYGIGTDIVTVERMEEGLARFGERFAARILSASEIEDYRKSAFPARFLAKRWAAKEAAAKALGTGFRAGITLSQIEITHDELGKPVLNWYGEAELFVQRQGINSAHLSISDEKHMAVAFVTLSTA